MLDRNHCHHLGSTEKGIVGDVVCWIGIADLVEVTVNYISQQTVCSAGELWERLHRDLQTRPAPSCFMDLTTWAPLHCCVRRLWPSMWHTAYHSSPSESSRCPLAEGCPAAALNSAELVHWSSRLIPVSALWGRKNCLLVPSGGFEVYQDWWGGLRPQIPLSCSVLHVQHSAHVTFAWITNSIAINWEYSILHCSSSL